MFNQQLAAGYLAADAEITAVADGRYVANFRVGSSYRYLDREGQTVEHTEWFNVKTFISESQKGVFMSHLLKGALVFFHGRTRTESYTKDNEQRTVRKVECDAHNVHFLREPKPASERKPAASQARSSPSATPTASQPQREPAPAARETHAAKTPAMAPAEAKRGDLLNFDA